MLRLANGHTIKTAAALEGMTENAAHELLRSARRKLGVGSSREAARLFAGAEAGAGPPKNRDENAGLPEHRCPPSLPALFTAQGGLSCWEHSPLAAGAIGLLLLGRGSSETRPAGGLPRVVSTKPVPGGVIQPGRFALSVTFDRPMAPQSYSFVQTHEGPFPDCRLPPRQSSDGRTWEMDCTATAGRTHVVWFNRGPYLNFRAASEGRAAEPYRLQFRVREN